MRGFTLSKFPCKFSLIFTAMSTIRRQSIISSLVIYIGFAVGLLNTYFFTKHFSTQEYGLTSVFVNIATMMMAFASLAMPAYINKFYPYYKDHLPAKKNDIMSLSLLIGCVGFLMVMIAGWVFRDLVIRKFGQNAPQLLTYYYWIFPMGLGLTLYMILEAYTWNIGKPVLTNFLKEVQWRLVTTVIIILFITQMIDYSEFIKMYAFTYPVIALTLFAYLVISKKIHFSFSLSKVSRRYYKKILIFCLLVYSSQLVFYISQVFDTLVIASVLDQGLGKAGIFSLATILTSVIAAPHRGVIAASVPHLARAWKDKNHGLLDRVYKRSSINLLIFSSGIFLLIALNYKDAIITFDLNRDYLLGFNAFLFLGATRIVDMGTGVNTEIIGTSNYWRFQLISGIILLVTMLPLTYFLTKGYDILGPAIANFVSIGLYNTIRIIFLWRKFNLQPFTSKTIYTILFAIMSFIITYYIFRVMNGFGAILIRSIFFFTIYAAGVLLLKLSPDIQPVIQTIRKRFGR